jgi:hypothetical protein
MRRLSFPVPSPAMMVALVALFIALGGTGYAATQLNPRGASAVTAKKKKKKTSPSETAQDTALFKKLATKATVLKALTANTANVANTANFASTANAANTANTANKANTASTANNANALGGSPPSTYQSAANVMFATVNSGTSPTIAHGRGATAVTNLDASGEYAVTFDQPIANCTWVATAGPATASPGDAILAVVRARDLTNHPNDVQVNLFTSFTDTETIGQGFHLVVLCP